MSSCACKGIRKCAVCEPKLLKEADEFDLNQSKLFIYCHKCNKCIPIGDLNFIDDFLLNSTDHKHSCSREETDSFQLNGIFLREDFITDEEEHYLLQEMNQVEWKESQSGRYKQDYGPKVNFKKQKLKLDEFKGLPKYTKFLIDRFKQIDQLNDYVPVELCNLKYDSDRAACIDPHLDDTWLWGDRLLTVNLVNNTFLTLSKKENNLMNVLIPLKKRSLLVLSNEARYEWLHEIKKTHIKSLRIAINIRELSSEFIDTPTGNELKSIALSYQG